MWGQIVDIPAPCVEQNADVPAPAPARGTQAPQLSRWTLRSEGFSHFSPDEKSAKTRRQSSANLLSHSMPSTRAACEIEHLQYGELRWGRQWDLDSWWLVDLKDGARVSLSYGGTRGSSISEGLNSLGWVQFGVFGFGVLEQLFLFMHLLNAFEFGVDLCGHAHRVKSRAKIHNNQSRQVLCIPFVGGTGSARRRRQRRLRQWLRHERMTVAVVLAETQHHSASRGQKMARTREEERDELNNAMRQTTPPPAGTQYFTMDDVSVPEQFGVRQAPVQEPRAQEGIGRHTEVSFELVLDPVVPQLGRKKAEPPPFR